MTTTSERVGDTTDRGYTRLARFESASRPGTFYWVSADRGGAVSCQCRGWIHHKACRHTAEVERLSSALGGVAGATRLVRGAREEDSAAGRAASARSTTYVRPAPVRDAIAVEAETVARHYFARDDRFRLQATLQADVEAAIRRFAAPAAVPEPAPFERPDWLGGVRAIRLRG